MRQQKIVRACDLNSLYESQPFCGVINKQRKIFCDFTLKCKEIKIENKNFLSSASETTTNMTKLQNYYFLCYFIHTQSRRIVNSIGKYMHFDIFDNHKIHYTIHKLLKDFVKDSRHFEGNLLLGLVVVYETFLVGMFVVRRESSCAERGLN